jgi:hypothetical protein
MHRRVGSSGLDDLDERLRGARLRDSALMTYFADARFSGTRNRQLWLGESTWSAELLAKLAEDAQAWMMKFSWKSDAA